MELLPDPLEVRHGAARLEAAAELLELVQDLKKGQVAEREEQVRR